MTTEQNLSIRAGIFLGVMGLWYLLGFLVSGLEYNPATWGWFGRAAWAILAVATSLVAALIPLSEYTKLLGLPQARQELTAADRDAILVRIEALEQTLGLARRAR